MFLEIKELFSFTIFDIKIEISNLLFGCIIYSLIVWILIFDYKTKGFFYKILNKIYGFIGDLSQENIGSRKFQPLLFFLFFAIGLLNLLRCLSFPIINSCIYFPLTFASVVFFVGLFSGFRKHRLKFFLNLVPHEIPLVIKPFLIIIETFTLFLKPVILCIRLLLNISVGNLVIHSLHRSVDAFGNWGGLTLPIFVLLNFLEIGIGFLQAYTFILFSSLFIRSCIEEH